MKISLLLILCLLSVVLFTGCATTKNTQPRVVTEVKTVTVRVPIIYPVPEIKCEFTGKGVTPIAKLLDCIVLQKRVLNEIREYNKRIESEYKEVLKK